MKVEMTTKEHYKVKSDEEMVHYVRCHAAVMSSGLLSVGGSCFRLG